MQATVERSDATYAIRCATYFIQNPFASLLEVRYFLKRTKPFSHHATISSNRAIIVSVHAIYALLFSIIFSDHAHITLYNTVIFSNDAIISLLRAVIFLVEAIVILVRVVI